MHVVIDALAMAKKYRGWVVNKDVKEPGAVGELLASSIVAIKLNARPAGDKRAWTPPAQDCRERTHCYVVAGRLSVIFSATADDPDATEYIVDAGEAFCWRDEGHITEALEDSVTFTVRWKE